MKGTNGDKSRVLGTVTRVEASSRNGRIDVHLDGSLWRSIDALLVSEAGITPGKNLSATNLVSIAERQDVLDAQEVALRYLAHCARTAHEVRRKLSSKGYDGAQIDAVIRRLKSWRYVDDRAYAVSFARHKFDIGGFGPHRIRYDLRRKGVSDERIEAALNEIADGDITRRAREQAEKRLSRLEKEANPYKKKGKLVAYLYRCGYDNDTVWAVVADLLP